MEIPQHKPGPQQSNTYNATDYSAEVRFGVVMYGGVSLAIYINGVASELFEMACATPRLGVRLELDADPKRPEPGTREIYRRLAWVMGNPELRALYARQIAGRAMPAQDVWDSAQAQAYSQTRLVVDVIAGTSAGGINGVFLAKALANGEHFSVLRDLWVEQGDIDLLLNDRRSYLSNQPPLADRSEQPTSLLNSDRMFSQLLSAMQAMTKAPLKIKFTPYPNGASPLVEEIDLFVTTTDIVGAQVPLRLFDKVVRERRHKQNYRFSYPNGVSLGGNDFDAVNNAFLAFASRCTSSFPFAFEPMTLNAVHRLKADAGVPGLTHWNHFFPNLPRKEVAEGAHAHRAFGDGGYLDNKPFSYVVEALSTRFASVPLERKLLYVEPAPANLDPDERPDPQHPPDALSNSIAALLRIPQYETIREDLQAVLQRNRRIERVERIVRQGETDIELHADPFMEVLQREGRIPRWPLLKLSDMARFYGLAFLPYQRLRVAAVTDALAGRLGERWGIDVDSDNRYALRALVRVWRELQFNDEAEDGRESINAFLDQFDLDYRVRRLGFLLRKIDLLTRLYRRHGRVTAGEPPRRLNEADDQITRIIAARLPAHFNPLDAAIDEETIRAALHALDLLKAGLIEVRFDLMAAQRSLSQRSPAQQAHEHHFGVQLGPALALVLGQLQSATLPGGAKSGQGESAPIRLDPKLDKVASASRTLQESVYLRAQALFEEARKVGRTELQQQVQASLDALRVKRSGHFPQGPEPPLNLISVRAWSLLGGPHLALADVSAESSAVLVQVGAASANTGNEARDAACNAALNTGIGAALRGFLGEYYLRFDFFDQISFPLYYDTGTGEPSTVEVVRVSPQDATHLIDETKVSKERHKLAGTALANFGAFLDRRWRRNDIMWGRLDGAERLIQVLLPMTDSASVAVKGELIALAHGSILRESLVQEGHGNLTDLLCQAMQEIPDMPGSDTGQRLRYLLEQLKLGDAPGRDRLRDLLAGLLSEQGLTDYVRNKREIDRSPDPKSTLKNAARAVTITGRVLERISTQQGLDSFAPRWLARLGLLLQGIVAVSLPGTLLQRWWTHGMKVLYAFEATALLFALLLGSGDMRTLAGTAIGLTLGLHLLSLIAGDLLRGRGRWLKLALSGLLIALLLLAGVGGFALVKVPLGKLLGCSAADAPSCSRLVQREVVDSSFFYI